MDILHATGVYKGFETGEGSLQVLRGVSLSLQAGQSLALTGEISILGLFFLASEAPCLGVNAYQIGDQCYYE